MINMILGPLVLLIWGFALCFFFFARWSKNKNGRQIFGCLSIILLITPILLYLFFFGLIQEGISAEEKEYIGLFQNSETGNFLQLNEDKTWQSDTSFNCLSGTWEYLSSEDFDYLELTEVCENSQAVIQILNSKPEVLTVSLSPSKAIVTLYRVE